MQGEHGQAGCCAADALCRSEGPVTHSVHIAAQMAAETGRRTRRAGMYEGGHMSDWTSFGRVDSDGTVYVKTTAGEARCRFVAGRYARGRAGAFRAPIRRHSDRVDLIEARLSSGAAEPGHTLTSLRRIRTSLDDAHVVGDLDGLASRLDKLAVVAEEKSGEARAARGGRPRRGPRP